MCARAYLVECMLDNSLTVRVGDAGEQVPDGSVGLPVDIFLSLRDGLRHVGMVDDDAILV